MRVPKPRLLVAAGACIASALFLTWAPYLRSHRPPSESDRVFSYFAENLGEASLCEKISWAAFQRYSMLFAGGGASFARSDCYESVAVKNKDPALCWRVRPLVDVNPMSDGYSALSCRRRVRQGSGSSVSIAPETLIRSFESLGYDADELQSEGVVGPVIRPLDVYRRLAAELGIVARVEQALSRPDAALTAADKNYLVHLGAVSSGDPRWCERIPAAAAVDTERIPFRDWCYLTLAYNTMDARVCERMSPAASEAVVIAAKGHGVRPEIAEQLSARTQCARIAHWVGPRPRYGPEAPQDPAQIERLIAATGMVMPKARDLPRYEIAAYYERFLDALREVRPGDPRRAAARTKLIARIKALPDTE